MEDLKKQNLEDVVMLSDINNKFKRLFIFYILGERKSSVYINMVWGSMIT